MAPADAGLAVAFRDAMTAVDGGHATVAAATLAAALRDVVLDVSAPDPDVSDAARLYAALLAVLDDPGGALPYSSYAHSVLVGASPTSARGLLAGVVHAYVLRVTDQVWPAAALWRDVVRRFVIAFGPDDRATLAGHADVAVALYEAGQCLTARQVLHQSCAAYRRGHPVDAVAIRMMARLASMTRACGGEVAAQRYADDAERLHAEHVPSDAALLDVVRDSRTVERHVCGQPSNPHHAGVSDLFVDLFAERPDLGEDADPAEDAGPADAPAENVGPADAPVEPAPNLPPLSDVAPTIRRLPVTNAGAGDPDAHDLAAPDRQPATMPPRATFGRVRRLSTGRDARPSTSGDSHPDH
jgi:hypothetical protein